MSKAKKVLESIKKLRERRTPEVHDEQEELLTVEDICGPMVNCFTNGEDLKAHYKALARARGEKWGFEE